MRRERRGDAVVVPVLRVISEGVARDVMSRGVVSSHVVWRRVTWCDVMPRGVCLMS